MARARERKRASARRRVETHDTGGGSNYLRLPDGYSFFQVKPGKYRLDFMCYEVTKGRGTDGGNPFFDEGELAYERTFWVHRDVGPNADWHLCAAKTLNEPCPICEFRAKKARDPDVDEQLLKDLAPKERQIWLPVDLSDPDQKLVWEFSHHLFGKQLDAKIRSGDEDDEYEFFADPESGLTVRVNFEQSDRGKWVEATDIEFRPRRNPYDLDVVNEQPDLDLMLVPTPYDKLKRLFLQTGEDEDDPAPSRRRTESGKDAEREKRRKPPADDTPTADDAGLAEGDVVSYCRQSWEIVRISKDGTSLVLEDENGTVVRAIGVDEVEKIEPPEDDEPEDKPAPKKKRPVKDDDEDWDDEPKKRKAAPKKTPKKKPAKDEDEDWDDDEDWD